MTTEQEHAKRKKALQEQALGEFELSVNVLALAFDDKPEVRDIAIKARGDIREALGEART